MQMDSLMDANPGLKSRFSEKLHFPDFNAADTCLMLEKLLNKEYQLALCPTVTREELMGMATQVLR
jgi:hypothetical protein